MMEEEAHQKNGITAERVLPFLRTHPHGELRLQNIKKHLPAAKKLFEQSQEPTKAQQVNRALVTVPSQASVQQEVQETKSAKSS